MHPLRDYQQLCVGDALAFFDEVAKADEEGRVMAGVERRRAYAAPTGTGKTLTATAILLALRAGGADAWVVTPSLEIARGFLRAQGVADADMPTGDEALFDLAEKHHVSTPTRMRNRVADGRKEVPDAWIVDELHHAIEGNEVSGCNFNMAPASVWIGFTATPYRGTPAGTQALREAWGEPILLLTYPEAVAQGACVVPTVEVVPLLDDDLVQVRGGEFVDKSASKEVVSRVEALASLVASYATPAVIARRYFDLPTLVAVPSTECVGALVEALDRLGVDAIPVTQSTTGEARLCAFEECRQRRAVIVQIKVVSEGVDLPWLGRLVDARPMVSPVAWLQQLGRLTRPGHGIKHYVCTNRNLERHAYLLQGAIPRSAVGAAQAAFKGPSKRGPGRIVGLEALGRLKPIELPLANGVKSTMFSVQRVVGTTREQFAILHDPCSDEPLVARREDVVTPGEEVQWGKWSRAAMPTDFDGFATSHRRGAASDKQLEVWRKHARRLGLDRDAEKLQGRQIDALFMLLQLGASLAPQEVA